MNSINSYLITHPKAEFNENRIAYSNEFNQSYHSTNGAIAESEYVFLNGVEIDKLFKRKKNLTIAEIGFGTGLNFILSYKAYLQSNSKPKIFNYLAFEKYPLTKNQLTSFYKNIDLHNDLSIEVIEQLKYLNPGFNRITLGQNKPILTLMIGDALEEIVKIDANVDAWYFDGFSPKANPDLWSNKLIRHCKRISNSNTVFTSFSCARYFKDNLINNQCSFRKISGFKNKREMLIGEIPNEKVLANKLKSDTVSIIGGGIAGCFLAHSLSLRGVKSIIYEAENEIAKGASGNPIGIFRPDFSLAPDLRNLFYFKNYLAMLRWLLKEKLNWNKFDCSLNGVTRFLHTKSLVKLYNDFPKEFDNFPYLKKEDTDSFFYPLSGILNPKKLSNFLVSNSELIEVKTHSLLKQIEKNESKFNLKFNTFSKEAKRVVLANAKDSKLLLNDLEISFNKGQLAYLDKNIDKTYCYGGYLANSKKYAVIGGSYEHNTESLELNAKQNEYMLNKLNTYLLDLNINNSNIIGGRASFRTYSEDKLPIVKEYKENFYLNLAHGSKGITTAFSAAEKIASLITGGPSILKL